MDLKELRKENEVLDIFCSLVSIPSPSLKEEKVIDWILDFCKKNNIDGKKDNYGNIYINVPAADSKKEPLMLSSHMDVVGDDSPVNIYLDGDFIKAEGRTLGADDKVGVACALKLAKDITILNISNVSSLADFFVIATADSTPHVKALMEEVKDRIKTLFSRLPARMENDAKNRWNLLDYGDVVVHILHKDERETYAIEKFWSNAFSISESEWKEASKEYSQYK